MDFSATIDLIIKDLKEAGEIIDDLKKYPGVPALQVELAKLKCKSAGEVIAMLKTMKEFIPPAAPEKEQVFQKEPQKLEISEENKPSVMAERISKPADERKNSSTRPEKESPLVTEKAEHKKGHRKEKESSILADKFSHMSDRINEQMGTLKGEEDIAEKLKTKHINSLSEAIGVNDKFLFIREIFNGNLNDYNQAISRLENTESLSDAKAIIMSYTGESEDNEASKELLDLVKRKLPADE